MSKLRLLIFIVALLFTSPAWAIEYYIDPTLTAETPNAYTVLTGTNAAGNCLNTEGKYYNVAARDCTGTDPTKKGYKSLYQANKNAVAGDIIYLRSGTYYVGTFAWNNYTDPGIIPTHDGTRDSMITYTNYNDEAFIMDGSGEEGKSKSAIIVSGRSWIKISGSAAQKLTFQNFMKHMHIINNSHHNEVAYCIFDNLYPRSYTTQAVVDSGGSFIGITYDTGPEQSCTYNHIHHCTFSRYGGATDTLYDGAYALGVGDVFNTTNNDLSHYNVIENNEFWGGGHATLGVHSRYNVVRNNYLQHGLWDEVPLRNSRCTAVGKPFHCCTGVGTGTCTTAYFGYFTMQVHGNEENAGYNLVEDNIVAFGAENINPTNYAGHGIKLCAQHNIIRYNDFVGNWLAGIGMRAYYPTEGTQYRNYPYSNSIYNNSFLGNGRHPAMFQGSGQNSYTQRGIILTSNQDIDLDVAFYKKDNNNIINNLIKDYQCWGTTSSSIYNSNEWWFQMPENGGPCDTDPEGANPCLARQNVRNNWDVCFGDADPLLVNETMPAYDTIGYVPPEDLPNLTLQPDSPAIDQGSYLTQASGAGEATTTLVVDDAKYFFDGKFGSASSLDPNQWPVSVTNINADWIAIGAIGNTVQISSINYSTNTITLASPMTWEDDAYIWLYKKSDGTQVIYGAAPDMGRHESEGGTSYTLTLTKSGTGQGKVQSDLNYINCGTLCESQAAEVWDGTIITLTATEYEGQGDFIGWTGDCLACGSDLECEVELDGDKTCDAEFSFGGEETSYALTLSKSGPGSGTVTSSPAGIFCGGDCEYNFLDDTEVTLTAVPTWPYIFSGWSGGGCLGTGTCVVTMSEVRNVTAVFGMRMRWAQ